MNKTLLKNHIEIEKKLLLEKIERNNEELLELEEQIECGIRTSTWDISTNSQRITQLKEKIRELEYSLEAIEDEV